MKKTVEANINSAVDLAAMLKALGLNVTVNINYGHDEEPVKTGSARKPRRFPGNSIGDRLVYARKKTGLTRKQAFDLVPEILSYSTFIRYENGTVVPPMKVLKRLADVYGCREENFLSKDEIELVSARREYNVGQKKKRRVSRGRHHVRSRKNTAKWRCYYPASPRDMMLFMGWCIMNELSYERAGNDTMILVDLDRDLYERGQRVMRFQGRFEA